MKTKPLAGKTITLPVFIHGEQASNYASEYESDFVFDGFKLRASSWNCAMDGEFVVTEAVVTFSIPADFDPVPPMVAAIEAKKAELTAEFTAAVMKLNKQLSELQAIEHTA